MKYVLHTLVTSTATDTVVGILQNILSGLQYFLSNIGDYCLMIFKAP